MSNEEQTGLFPKNQFKKYFDAAKSTNNGQIRMVHRTYPDASHNTSSIYAFTDGLRHVFEGYECDIIQKFGNSSDLEERIASYYDALSRKVGFTLTPSRHLLQNAAFELMYVQRRPELAIRIFQYSAKLYPGVTETFTYLGDAYRSLGDKENARKSYEKASHLKPEDQYVRDQLRQLN